MIYEGPIMQEYILKHNCKIILELGIWYGASTKCLLLTCKELGGHVWSVDINKYQATIDMVESMGLSKYWTPNWIDDLIYEWDKSKEIDLLFVDSEHTTDHVYKQLKRFSPFVKVGGAIFLHDTLFTGNGIDIADENNINPIYLGIKIFLQEEPPSKWKQTVYSVGHGLILLEKTFEKI